MRLRPGYAERVGDGLGVPVRPMDFGDAKTPGRLDDWVSEATRGRIATLGLEPTALTEFLLVNALHFKGAWAERFDKADTREAPFTLDGGERVVVPMMRRTGSLPAATLEGWTAVRLPFERPGPAPGGTGLAAVLALPRPGAAGAAGMPDWPGLGAALDAATPGKVSILLPRVKVEDTVDLVLALAGTSLGSVIGPGANYGELSEGGHMVTEGIQRSFLSIDEEGAEGAAVTAMAMTRSGEAESLAFEADRPFHLGIFDLATGVPVFLARIGDPRD
jgi:serpin B